MTGPYPRRRATLAALAAAMTLVASALAGPALEGGAWGEARAASHGGASSLPPVILVLGDSISAAYGLPPGTGWTDLLQERLRERGRAHRVVNASISGDTTAGGRSRLPALLARHKPAIVVIELGGNDGLRGGNLAATRGNLVAMISAARSAGAKVLIVGMKLPPNYGPAYIREFDATYAEVARAQHVPLVPFFFAGFGEDRDWFQPDGIHPTEAAQPRLLDNVWPAIERLLPKR
ncbi:acyl-CoA thioesterase I [Burkholderiales bacterium]|nr:acyl-CoA thioesterase I [Burkholderiales bacterium]